MRCLCRLLISFLPSWFCSPVIRHCHPSIFFLSTTWPASRGAESCKEITREYLASPWLQNWRIFLMCSAFIEIPTRISMVACCCITFANPTTPFRTRTAGKEGSHAS
ncbi:unnamed protein product [Cyprideis torosa]|uniref:Uncharacterized protein n=1 Tax=Cyprideis torosa TaxID=163714 RepID=A0A7R8ZPU7_9CRUS|nr:unnamed protein product [Cyprideis torosa]CAG0899767.1 unnamed protein product [Cyprideis torosa]